MPRGRKPEGKQTLRNDGRAIEHAIRRHQYRWLPAPGCAADRRSRPQRWRDAVSELLTIQATFANWFTVLPDGLRASSIAELLEAIVEPDLTDLVEIELPRGYGRD